MPTKKSPAEPVTPAGALEVRPSRLGRLRPSRPSRLGMLGDDELDVVVDEMEVPPDE